MRTQITEGDALSIYNACGITNKYEQVSASDPSLRQVLSC